MKECYITKLITAINTIYHKFIVIRGAQIIVEVKNTNCKCFMKALLLIHSHDYGIEYLKIMHVIELNYA